MAKATQAKGPPVAGMPGYDANARPQPLPSLVETNEREMAPETVQKKAHVESPAPIGVAAKSAKALDFLDHLVATGTPARNLIDARLHFTDQPDATAEQCFRFLESAADRGKEPINPGTIRKAGKWLWGNAWEPQNADQLAPADEMRKLRERVADLESQLTKRNAENVNLQRHNQFLRDKANTQAKDIEWLKQGRSADDLAGVGMEPAAV